MKGHRRVTLILLAAGCVSLIIALVIGIAENAPGIALLYGAALAGLLAFVHHWRRAKRFVVLAVASAVGFAVFAVLHNVFYGFSKSFSDIAPLRQALEVLDVVSFLIALIVCPVGLLVGVIGAILAYAKNRRGRA